jgi:hypothetical protein
VDILSNVGLFPRGNWIVLWAGMESWSADGRGWPHAPVWDFPAGWTGSQKLVSEP